MSERTRKDAYHCEASIAELIERSNRLIKASDQIEQVARRTSRQLRALGRRTIIGVAHAEEIGLQ